VQDGKKGDKVPTFLLAYLGNVIVRCSFELALLCLAHSALINFIIACIVLHPSNPEKDKKNYLNK
jgi:hypothetical protein